MRVAWKSWCQVLLAVAMLVAISSCAEKTTQMAAPPVAQMAAPPVAQPPGQTRFKDGVFYAPSLGLYWTGPSDFKPIKPGPRDDFLFGWGKPKEKKAVRLVVLGKSGLKDAAKALGRVKGWKLVSYQMITWQGRLTGDASYSAGKDQICARVLTGPGGLLVVYGQAPAKNFSEALPDLITVMDGFRLVPAADILHTVKRANETLDLIALWYTGGASNWGKLKSYNKLKSSRVRPGQQIKIPRDLVWRLDPMPVWAVRLYRMDRKADKKAAAGSKKREKGAGPGLELMPAGPK